MTTVSPKRSRHASLPSPSSPPGNTLSPVRTSFPAIAKVPLDSLSLSENTMEPIPEVQHGWFSKLGAFEWDLLVFSTVFKLLLFPAYRSTDFEVHRNWLAITHSLPISRWYYEATSEWTLDYPPFFAYFEWLMSLPAALIDPAIVQVKNTNYDAWTVVAFQRSTVIVTELVMGMALLSFIRGAVDHPTQRIISASLFLHPGFLIVDHIHFQYNGFMFGILLWSVLMARNGNKLASGILFAVLLNFKHIYMYLAPAYFIYLLRAYCMTPAGLPIMTNFLSLSTGVLSVFAVSFGPFALMGQIPQVLSRLFPFTRGLNHAYWAPNAWALVTAADRVLLKITKQRGIGVHLNDPGIASTSRGLVGDTVFAVLPTIKPIHTFAITIAFQSIFLSKLWKNPTYKSFVLALTLCGYASFMFGWHVHEKAILLVLVPFSLLAADNHAYFRTFVIASIAGIYSLFPLLFTPAETPIKLIYSLLWVALVIRPLSKRVYEFPPSLLWVIIDLLERTYLWGFAALQAFVSLFPVWARYRAQKTRPTTLEFLPLLLTSVYCSIGLSWAFLRLSVLYIRQKY